MAHLTAERDWRFKGYGHVKYGQGSRFGVSEIMRRQVLVDCVNKRRNCSGAGGRRVRGGGRKLWSRWRPRKRRRGT